MNDKKRNEWNAEPWMDQQAIIRAMGKYIEQQHDDRAALVGQVEHYRRLAQQQQAQPTEEQAQPTEEQAQPTEEQAQPTEEQARLQQLAGMAPAHYGKCGMQSGEAYDTPAQTNEPVRVLEGWRKADPDLGIAAEHFVQVADKQREVDNPLLSFDARVWAREFMRVHYGKSIATDGGFDEGDAIAWFANALMRGFDEHVWQTQRAEAQQVAAPLLELAASHLRQELTEWKAEAELRQRRIEEKHARVVELEREQREDTVHRSNALAHVRRLENENIELHAALEKLRTKNEKALNILLTATTGKRVGLAVEALQ